MSKMVNVRGLSDLGVKVVILKVGPILPNNHDIYYTVTRKRGELSGMEVSIEVKHISVNQWGDQKTKTSRHSKMVEIKNGEIDLGELEKAAWDIDCESRLG